MSYYYYKYENLLEVHYWLESDVHYMDAFIQNKCEKELLSIIKNIADVFNVEITIETQPLTEGGLKRLYKIIANEERKKAIITTAIVSSIATVILTTPIMVVITHLTEAVIENVFNREDEKLHREKEKLELQKLKQEIKLDSLKLIEAIEIQKSRSEFYRQLSQENKVQQLSFILKDETKKDIIDEQFVLKASFDDYQTNEQPHFSTSIRRSYQQQVEVKELITELSNVKIEIVSPVFLPNSDKWIGIYKGKVINFKMMSKEFDSLVQSGNFEFKKGMLITCVLRITKLKSRSKYEVLEVQKRLD